MKREGVFCDGGTKEIPCIRVGQHVCAVCLGDACWDHMHHRDPDTGVLVSVHMSDSIGAKARLRLCKRCWSVCRELFQPHATTLVTEWRETVRELLKGMVAAQALVE